MKAVILGVMVALLCIGGTAVADDHFPDPNELWKTITEKDPYRDWGFFPDHQGMLGGSAPHGQFNAVYVNDIAAKAGHPKGPGAIIVKENYNADKKLVAYTVMYKVKGYNPEAGDWFWAKYDPDGTTLMAGKPKGCIACHTAAQTTDYIMVSGY